MNSVRYFTIHGGKYSTEKVSGSGGLSYYESSGEATWTALPFDSLEEAALFLLDTYPEYNFGANIVETDRAGSRKENGSFLMIAVPDYFEEQYGTNDREQIIQEVREEMRRKESEYARTN